MRFEELREQFDMPVYAMDFSSLAAALESGFDNECREFEAAV